MAAAAENISRIKDWYQERLELAHRNRNRNRNRKNRSHPAIYKERDSMKYRSEGGAATPKDKPVTA
jgi:hypothetical protein